MASANSSHLSEKAVSGFAKADLYEEHRPSYPQQAVAILLDAAAVNGYKGARLVDLAAGTGKFTELLAAREEQFSINAVEPHHEMRKQLEQKALNNVTVTDGLSTAIPEETESVDAVFAAQAFHWFANEGSLKEIHRVLKPVGVFGMIWNAEDYNTPRSYSTTSSWEAQLRDHLFSLDDVIDDHQPRFRHDRWRGVFDEQLSSTPITAALVGKTNSLFSLPLGEQQVKWTVWLEQEALWQRLRTLSHVAVLEGENLEKTRQIFDAALSGGDVQRNDKGEIAVHGSTVIAWSSKIP
ncbi:S-adenosyl-L-methionine-dependent methyltransferase [Lophiostoma macrostomum CBS 122681]|uniref:S-adenosyl-L-methionine-dependent methyltransferase n=1 Tax=Lophiostoma macrostomum CBS 122681 TaxID=1314788 RepID=A0A6A6TBK1_9PLEO|nr:S-adenosyl-L-methionine-dependent methyltransferase [Lophiostoma macrostomum CBS 122681]